MSFKVLGIIAALSLMNFHLASAVTIQSIDFNGDKNEITIKADGPIQYTQQQNDQDSQVVIDLTDATLSSFASRNFDTSSFNSPVSLISPYQVDPATKQARIVVQLRSASTASFAEKGNSLVVSFSGSGMDAVPESGQAGTSPEDDFDLSEDQAGGAAAAKTAATATASPVDGNPEADKAKSTQDLLDKFMETRKNKNFSGAPITLQVRDAEVTDVLRLIGEASGFNMVVGDDVTGKITLSLVDVPWDQALDVVLSTMRLGAERNNNILRILTLKNLTAEKKEVYEANQAAEQNAPRVTKVFPISYAELTELQRILKSFGNAASIGANGQLDNNQAAKIEVDQRTNSIIVQDIAENLERMTRLVELLDTQTPQVMVEAKVVEATEGFRNSVSGSLGLGDGTGNNQFLASFNSGNPIDSLVGGTTSATGGAAFAAQSAGGGAFGTSLDVGFLPGVERINAVLQMSESERTAKVISSPKTVVLNKQKANIVTTQPQVFIKSTQLDSGNTIQEPTQIDAQVSLEVTPTVTNDESVLLELNIHRDIPVTSELGPAIGKRNMQTKVLVDSGSTLVIGGIYDVKETEFSGGFPVLRKLPILGYLFGSENKETDRTELFIFITPRILNLKQAGLSG